VDVDPSAPIKFYSDTPFKQTAVSENDSIGLQTPCKVT
jgi:hypothetical protein